MGKRIMTLKELLEEPERAFLPPDDEKVIRQQEMIAARNTLTRAIVAGKVIPSSYCEGCGKKTKTEGHHPIYGPEFRLSVIWLCKNCHSQVTGRITRRNNDSVQNF